MKKIKSALITGVLIAGFLSLSASAQLNDARIGFMHFQDALLKIDEVKPAVEGLEQFAAEKKDQSDRLSQQLAGLRQELANSTTLDAAAREQLEQEIQQSQIALQRFQEDSQRDIDRRLDAIFRDYGKKLQTVTVDYANSNGYQAIFALDSLQVGFLDDSVNLTDKIVEAYNRKHPHQ